MLAARRCTLCSSERQFGQRRPAEPVLAILAININDDDLAGGDAD
jgi:hypothetical protein